MKTIYGNLSHTTGTKFTFHDALFACYISLPSTNYSSLVASQKMLVYTFIRLLYRELLHSCKHDITIISIFSKPGRKHFSVYCVWPTVLLVLWFFCSKTLEQNNKYVEECCSLYRGDLQRCKFSVCGFTTGK